jgi:hypothetical protein
MGHYQPAKDQKVTVAEQGLEGHKKTLYFFWQTSYLDHGWPLEERMKGCLVSSFYSLGGWPASLCSPSKDYTPIKYGTNYFSKAVNL